MIRGEEREIEGLHERTSSRAMPSRWLAVKDFLLDSSSKAFFSSSSRSSSSSRTSYPDYDYERLDNDSNMAAPEEVIDSESTRNHGAVDAALAKRVLRKIDMRLIPLLFITYGLNFMDKTILSSASVFGLRDDTVCSATILMMLPVHYTYSPTSSLCIRISSGNSILGYPPYSTLATSSGPPSPTSSSPACPSPAT